MASLFLPQPEAPRAAEDKAEARNPVLVELFTSQG
jgi:hypothetical protein